MDLRLLSKHKNLHLSWHKAKMKPNFEFYWFCNKGFFSLNTLISFQDSTFMTKFSLSICK
jgi:hypothetical protein